MESNKEKNIISNYIFNLMFQILTMIIPLVTTPYLSRVLGPQGTGIYSYTYSVMSYFLLLGMLGSTLYAQREIAYIQDDLKKRSKTFWEIIIIRIISLSISMLMFYLIYGYKGEYSFYYKIFLLEFIATMLDTGWFFQGIEQFKKIVIRGVIIKIVSIILIFTIVKQESDLYKYVLIYVISTMVGSLSLLPYLKKYIIKIKFRELELKKHIKPILILLIPQIATQVYTLIDRVMIGNILNDMSEVGYYEQAQKIIKLLIMIITSLGTIMLPRIANNFANGNEKKIQEHIENSFSFVFAIGMPIAVGIMVVSHEFVPLFYGPGYDKVEVLLKTIAPLIVVIGLTNVLGTQYLLPTKKQKEYNISVIFGAIINVIINIIFITLFGSVGACIATIIAEMGIFLVQSYFVRKKITVVKYLKRSKNYILASAIMGIICSAITYLNINPLKSIGLKIICGIIVYIIALILIKDKFIIRILNKVVKFKKIREEM